MRLHIALDDELVAELDRRAGARQRRWRRDLARRGVTVHQADCLVAAAAVGIGAPLATANVSDFPMSEVTVEHWPIGE